MVTNTQNYLICWGDSSYTNVNRHEYVYFCDQTGNIYETTLGAGNTTHFYPFFPDGYVSPLHLSLDCTLHIDYIMATFHDPDAILDLL